MLYTQTSLALLILVAISGCASGSHLAAPCFDGWTTEGEDVSQIVTPPDSFWGMVSENFDVERSSVKCVHYLSVQRKYILIVDGIEFDFETITIRETADSFEFVERGIIL